MARKIGIKNKTGVPRISGSRFLLVGMFAVLPLGLLISCTVLQTRPVQEMSDTSAAISAAKEVQADTFAPELYRQASEWFSKARQEYKLKNFKLALDFSKKARTFAEQAEFEAIRNGGNRTAIESAPDPLSRQEGSPPSQGQVPDPQGTPADVYDDRKKQEDALRNAAPPAPPSGGWTSPQPDPLKAPGNGP